MHHPRSFLALCLVVLAALGLEPLRPPGARPLAGTAFAAPLLDVSPTTVDYSIMSGESESRTVTVSNTGDADLEFTTLLGSPPPGGIHLLGPKVAVHLTDVVTTKGVYFCDPSSAGGPAPDDFPCYDFVTRAPLGTGRFLYIVVAETDSNGIGGVQFGIEYDDAPSSGMDVVGNFNLCTNGLQFPSATWPASGSGNVITWNVGVDCPGTRIGPQNYQAVVGGFYVYAYSDDVFRITEHTQLQMPSLKIARCSAVEVDLDPATAAGSAAFSNNGTFGANPCAGTQEGGSTPLWLSVNPAEGTVPPGGNALLQLTADATGIPAGTSYSAIMQVNSNAPYNAAQDVLVGLDVTGQPGLGVSATFLDFGFVYLGSSGTRTLVVYNAGTQSLHVSDVTVDNPDFSVSEFPFDLGPGASRLLDVTFTPGSAGPASGILTVHSPTPIEATINVALQGTGVPSPVFAVSPDSVGYALPEGEMETRTLTLSNTGSSDLDWVAQLFAGAPEPAEPKVALHVQDHIVSKTYDPCSPASVGGPAPTDIPCSEYTTAAPLNRGQDLYIVVGNADSAGVGGVQFGIEYNDAWSSGVDLIGSFRLCASGLQFPSSTWPASGSGNVITWNVVANCATTEIPPNGVHGIAGAFYVYAYSADTFRITEHTQLVNPRLSMANCNGVVQDLDPATDAGSVAFSSSGQEGFNPCAGSSTAPPLWLSVNPAMGTIPPGGDALVELTADASGLVEGASYAARLRLDTNDPVRSRAEIPVTLDVLYPPVDAADVSIEPATLNASSGGSWVFAAVELPAGYDPADLVLETVRALGSVPADPTFTEYVDFNKNGVTDRKMRFSRAAVIAALPVGDVVAFTVMGEIREQATLYASQDITVIRPHLLSPGGGETFAVGTWVNVTWQKPSGWEDMTTSLLYWSKAAKDWVPIADGLAGDHHPWQVVDELSSACRLRVEAYASWGLAGFDESGPFTIAEQTTGIGDTPSAGILLQNSPNPFRGSTVIRFALPGEDHVSIRVFDAAGRRVRSLIDAALPAGPHEVSWNGRDEAGRPVASGIYFYRMETSDRRAMKRMFLLR